MSRHALNDDQWAVIESLIPKQKLGAGRKRADDRKTLNGILYLLKTSCAWEDLSREYISDTTCWRRLNECVQCKNRVTEKHEEKNLPCTDTSSKVRHSYVLVCRLPSVFLSARSVHRPSYSEGKKRVTDTVQ